MEQEHTPSVDENEIYRQHYTYFTNMTNLLFTMPIGLATIIGGAWALAGAFINDAPHFSFLLFLFAGISSLAFANVMYRFKTAYSAYIDNLNEMDGKYRVTIRHLNTPSTAKTVIILMLIFGGMSFVAAVYVFQSVELAYSPTT